MAYYAVHMHMLLSLCDRSVELDVRNMVISAEAIDVPSVSALYICCRCYDVRSVTGIQVCLCFWNPAVAQTVNRRLPTVTARLRA
jgi:hypothetical protein